jgi:hypothetical protein
MGRDAVRVRRGQADAHGHEAELIEHCRR